MDRLLAVFALVLTLVFLALVLRRAFLGVAFLAVVLVSAFLAVGLVLLALFRVLAALLTERRRARFSGFVTGAAAVIDAGRARLRPSPVDLASWERRSE
jgi:hypothetical protein